MRIEPVGDHVVIKRLETDEKTPGGIYLPDNAREKPARGLVLSVGSGRRLENGTICKSQVGEGDRVVFTSYAAAEIEVDGEELLILSENDILAVIE